LLFCLTHDGSVGSEELFAEHCRWGEIHGRVPAVLPPHANEPVPDRRLRIGYVSPDLRDHAVARFFAPVDLLRLPEGWQEPRPLERFAEFLGADPIVPTSCLHWAGSQGYVWEPRLVGHGSYELFGFALRRD